MPLSAGTRIGSYEVTGSLGAGGMGEVYRARDTRLNRDVALKILPSAFTADPERLARFEREAQVLASLNHPHIAAIYGIEESNGAPALVLELVEGPTLSDVIAQGPLAIEEAIGCARQIAEALEAAHERGIVHRDLKPANIKLTSDQHVKVLDFGLARLVETGGAGGSDAARLSMSPTITNPGMMTGVGIILGTAAYMSPEQAKGGVADHRSDVFSLGVVLYEMLTGRQPFRGETAADVLASVLVREADLTGLPPSLNPRLTELLRRCLEKSPRRRWQAVGDVRAELETIALAPRIEPARTLVAVPSKRLWRRVVPVVATALVFAAIGGAAVWMLRPSSSPTPVRQTFRLPEGQQFTGRSRRVLAIAPNATHMAYVANGRLYLRAMANFDARPIPGTEDATITHPVFSPNGRTLVFYSVRDQAIKMIGIDGGVAQTISSGIQTMLGMSWSGESIIFGQASVFQTSPISRILRVSSNGGAPEVLVELARGELALNPQILPGGEGLVFTIGTSGELTSDDGPVVAYSLKTRRRTPLVKAGTDARFISTGHLVYAVGGTLYAVGFDPKRLKLTDNAEEVPIIEGVNRSVTGGVGSLSAYADYSSTGWLVYISGASTGSAAARSLVRVDRASGDAQPLKLPSRPYLFPRISPDGKRLAYEIDTGGDANVFVYDLGGNTSPTQLTFGGRNRFPVWSSDSQRVAFQSDRERDLAIFWQRADGTDPPARLTTPEKGTEHVPESWRPKSDIFSYSVRSSSSVTLRTFSIREHKETSFGDLRSEFPLHSVFSPDGRWIAYTLRGGGRANVYVQPFPFTGAGVSKISGDAGHHPFFASDPLELFYLEGGNMVRVGVTAASSFRATDPLPAPGESNTSPILPRNSDISPDGRFLIKATGRDDEDSGEIRIVQNWFEELKSRVK